MSPEEKEQIDTLFGSMTLAELQLRLAKAGLELRNGRTLIVEYFDADDNRVHTSEVFTFEDIQIEGDLYNICDISGHDNKAKRILRIG